MGKSNNKSRNSFDRAIWQRCWWSTLRMDFWWTKRAPLRYMCCSYYHQLHCHWSPNRLLVFLNQGMIQSWGNNIQGHDTERLYGFCRVLKLYCRCIVDRSIQCLTLEEFWTPCARHSWCFCLRNRWLGILMILEYVLTYFDDVCMKLTEW